MEAGKWTVDIEIFDQYGDGHWAQARYLVHSHDDVLWTDDIDAALAFLRASVIELSKSNDS